MLFFGDPIGLRGLGFGDERLLELVGLGLGSLSFQRRGFSWFRALGSFLGCFQGSVKCSFKGSFTG